MSSEKESIDMGTPPTKKFKSMGSDSENETEDEGGERSLMSLFKMKVQNIFSKVIDRADGDFIVSGQLENAPMVVISMKNADYRKIHFPLYEEEAERVMPFFDPSPFGKGTETVLDISIRSSWQLNPQQFEILNPDWKSYMNNVLVPRIGKELCIRSSFKALLYKLLLYETGSFFKSHRDSEKEDGMFATLVIQLPSKYKGGQLIVNHDGKSKNIDFSSSECDSNVFRTFFSVFYCDCEHEVRPLTEGFRFCLVYNLISEEADSIPVPSVGGVLEMEPEALFKDWTTSTKIVYALKHKYSERSLSLDNLKTSDKAVANVLKFLSELCGLDIYLAVFEKDVTGQGDGRGNEESDNFDTDDEDYLESEEYKLNCLVPVSASTAISGLFLKTVDFKDEVIPENCFAKMKPCHKYCAPTGNEGVHVSKSYRTAAIVFWPRIFAMDILKASGVSQIGLANLFLEEVEKCEAELTDEKNQQMLLKTAKSALISNDGQIHNVSDALATPLLTALIGINDLNLVRQFLEQGVKLNESILPLVMEYCKKLGWQNFSTQLVSMFKKVNVLNLKQSPTLLNMLIGNELQEEKVEICRKILETILDSLKGNAPTSSAVSYFQRRTETDKFSKMAKLNEDHEFLNSLCSAARKLNYDLIEFMKNKVVTVAVQVLINLANSTGQLVRLDGQWEEIGNHFVAELQKHVATKSSVLLWGRQITIPCDCKDCQALIAFLKGNDQSIDFKIPKTRRKHLQVKMKSIRDLKHEEDENGNLKVTKTRKTGQDLVDACNVSVELLEKLRRVL